MSVLIGARIPVRWFEEAVPTPLVAFAARELGATAAVVVTASHNPREDNGYKVYLDDAVQLVHPDDVRLEEAIARVGPANAVPRVDPEANRRVPLPERVDAEPLDLEALFQRYLAQVTAELGSTPESKSLRIAYTPLHGVGLRFTRRALALAGFSDVHVVPEQAEPDGAFPTAPFPNPEEPGALDRALSLARTRERGSRAGERPRRRSSRCGGPDAVGPLAHACVAIRSPRCSRTRCSRRCANRRVLRHSRAS